MSKDPPVSYTTETLAELQARYPKALEFVYDQIAIEEHNAIRPGEVAAQVFDFKDGLRLIVSRELLQKGDIVLHVSASFQDECCIADRFRYKSDRNKRKLLWEFIESIPARFAELAQDKRPIKFIGMTDRLIPHWVRPEEPNE